jgi:hypothetical protein
LSRKVILLNLALIALIGSMVSMLRARWLAEKTHERVVLGQSVPPKTVFAPPAPAPPKAVTPAEYLDVAQKDLFSKDRNPTVPVDAPPPPPPPPPMPALPNFHGLMMFGDPVLILSTDGKGAVQKGYRVGDAIGPFKLIAFDRDNVTFEWKGKQVERKLEELAPKEAPPPVQQAPPPAPSGPAASAPGQVTSLSPIASPATSDGSVVGSDAGGGFRGCTAGDNSPSGTVKDGYKKVVTQTLFGSSCHWEQVK